MSDTQKTIYRVIFGTDTPAGRNFDLLLIVAILLSVFAVTLDSITPVRQEYSNYLNRLEWGLTLLFTLEYGLRIYCSPNPKAYITSFYGIVDLFAILPTYLSLFFPAASMLLVIRLIRVLRIFRVLKLMQYSGEANVLLRSLIMARRKLFVFVFSVMIVVTIFGSLMYIIEGPAYGFTSIPKSIYWAIVTVTTVGYGDITPHTIGGQAIASLAMLTGYAILAVPTGIISAELIQEIQRDRGTRRCSNCEKSGHERSANFCLNCGTELRAADRKGELPPA
ncbi:MAG: voltage-gated potassium channel [Oceanicoccus sp.]|jgi:voltage-gated potassium channel